MPKTRNGYLPSVICVMTVAATMAHAAPVQPTPIFQKVLPDGRTLCITRKRMPPDPKVLAEATAERKNPPKELPIGAKVVLPDYSNLHSFVVTDARGKSETLWSLRLDHFEGFSDGDNPDANDSLLRVLDATAEAHNLIVVYKKSGRTFATIVQPEPKGGWKRTPYEDSIIGTDHEAQGIYAWIAKIGGSYKQGTLTVDLTYTKNGVERFLWKDGKWVKQGTRPAAPPGGKAESPQAGSTTPKT